MESRTSPPHYDEIADWYATWVHTESRVHRILIETLPQLMGDVSGQRILDVACGEGIFARLLATHGAQVVGVDLSPRMVELANESKTPATARVGCHVDDAQTLATLADEHFDGAVCMMALMDIPDLEATCRSVRRVVKSGGWFIVAITHPCFEAPNATWEQQVLHPDAGRVIRTYLEEGPWSSEFSSGVRGKVGARHRTLGTYLNTMIATGWMLERFVELVSGVEGQNPRIPSLVLMRFCAR